MSESLLDFDTWPSGIASASIPANNNVRRSEVLAANVVSATTTAEPTLTSPTDDRLVYIIPAAATGTSWSAFDEGDLAIWIEGTWTAFAPYEGLRKFVLDEGADGEDWQYVAGAWAAAAGGGGGTPGGSDTQVQFNDASAFGGDAGLVYNKTTDTLTTINLLSTTNTLTGLLLTAASATGGSGLRVPHGTAPSAPVNGDIWTTTAGMYAYINGVTVGPFSAGGGGLTGFTASDNTASPNNTVNAARLIVASASTNADFVAQPKGSGAFQLQLADNTTTGGNKRGTYSVDLQLQRSGAAQVASGSNAVTAGTNNTASASRTAALGYGNVASTADASAFGSGSTASGQFSLSLGYTSTASGSQSVALNGGTADAQYSFAHGPGANTQAVVGMRSWLHQSGTGRWWNELMVQGSTTSATPVVLTSNAGAAAATNQMRMDGANNGSCIVIGYVVARQTGNAGAKKSWKFEAHLDRDAGTLALVSAVTPTVIANNAGAASWTLAVTADDTLKTLKVEATGETAKTIRWSCHLQAINTPGT